MGRKSEQIVISGAGLVGSLLAIHLLKRGHQVAIYERREDMRLNKISAGKSINLAVSNRGWKALDNVGIGNEIRKIAIPMKGRMMHDSAGNLSFQPYGVGDQAIYSVSRGGLNMKMMDLAEEHGAKIYFNEKCIAADFDNGSLTFQNTNTEKTTEVKADRFFGADGAFSAVRGEMQKTDRFNYSQTYIDHGYKELNIPATDDGQWKIEKNALHIWPRGNYMLIALPNLDGSFTCTLFFPFEGEHSFSTLKTDEQIMSFFRKVFPDAVELMPTLLEDYKSNPTSSLCLIRCFPWTKGDNFALIGDASHAIVPFYGQGMISGFEDITVLDNLLTKHDENWGEVFKAYEISRKPNADAIADLALKNFVEMRDLVGDQEFIRFKKYKLDIYEKYPDKFIPQYVMATFTDTPYADALRIGDLQDEFLKNIIDKYPVPEDIPQEVLSELFEIK